MRSVGAANQVPLGTFGPAEEAELCVDVDVDVDETVLSPVAEGPVPPSFESPVRARAAEDGDGSNAFASAPAPSPEGEEGEGDEPEDEEEQEEEEDEDDQEEDDGSMNLEVGSALVASIVALMAA